MYGRALVHVFQIKRRPHVGHVHLAGIQLRHAVPFGFRQPDVKVQIQRFADVFLPVTPQAFPGQPQHEFIKHHPVSMRMVAVFRRLPRRNGFLQGAHAILMVKYAYRPGKSRQTALMGHHLRDGCIGQREFRPQFPHAHLRRGSLLVQGQQKGGGCGSLGGGVNGHQRMFRPWMRFIRCGKPGMQGNDFPSLLPDRNGSAQFSVVTPGVRTGKYSPPAPKASSGAALDGQRRNRTICKTSVFRMGGQVFTGSHFIRILLQIIQGEFNTE